MDHLLEKLRTAPAHVRRFDWRLHEDRLLIDLDVEQEAWCIEARGVADAQIRSKRVTRVEVTDEHPLLWPHRYPARELVISAAPPDPQGTLLELLAAEPEDEAAGGLLPAAEVLATLKSGHGTVAAGPLPRLERLAAILAARGAEPHFRGRSELAADFRLLLLGAGHVVASEFDARRA